MNELCLITDAPSINVNLEINCWFAVSSLKCFTWKTTVDVRSPGCTISAMVSDYDDAVSVHKYSKHFSSLLS